MSVDPDKRNSPVASRNWRALSATSVVIRVDAERDLAIQNLVRLDIPENGKEPCEHGQQGGVGGLPAPRSEDFLLRERLAKPRVPSLSKGRLPLRQLDLAGFELLDDLAEGFDQLVLFDAGLLEGEV